MTNERKIESLEFVTQVTTARNKKLPNLYKLVYTIPATDASRTIPITKDIFAEDMLGAYAQAQKLLTLLNTNHPWKEETK